MCGFYSWHTRVVALPQSVSGTSVQAITVTTEHQTGVGTYDTWIGDVSIVSADGAVTPLYRGQAIGATSWYNCDSQLSVATEATPVDGFAGTTYYAGDQVGTTQMEFAVDAWPIQRSEFAPFGQELSSQDFTRNRFKFTGKERDTESGLDYFGARYYSSGSGRWMSPDWSSNPSPIPFGNIYRPQSLNLYSYVGNRPLTGYDPYGHLDCGSGGASATASNGVLSGIGSFFHGIACGVAKAFGGGGGNSNANTSSNSGDAGGSPVYKVSSRIITGVSDFNQRYAPNFSSVGWSGSRAYGLGYGFAASIGNDVNVYNPGDGNTLTTSSSYGYTGMNYRQPGGVAYQTHDDDTVFGLGLGVEAHAGFGRTSTYPSGSSTGSQSSLNIGIVNASWSHSEGWGDYQFTVGVGPTGFSYVQMHTTTVIDPFRPLQ